MKNRYLIGLIVSIIGIIGVMTYKVDLPPFGNGKVIRPEKYVWSFTGESFVTTYNDRQTPVPGAKDTHACLSGNDESCFLITVWKGNYASYFYAYRTANYKKMMAMSGSELTEDDLQAQIAAGFTPVREVPGLKGTTWRLVDIGLEQQHLYIERPWGTLIITDMLGLKGPSYPERKYIEYINMPQYIIVE